MAGVSIYEHGLLVENGSDGADPEPEGARVCPVPPEVFDWLKKECLRASARPGPKWGELTLWRGAEAVKVANYVGVVRAPNGFQIEILPKIGRLKENDREWARKLLLDMLKCLRGFRHIRIDSAFLMAKRMPLLEVFIREFLLAVNQVVKRGLRSAYEPRQENIFALRGKLQISQQIRQNVHRADRFFAEYDEFSPDRPENRLLHSALKAVLKMTRSRENDRLARELCFVFADIPESVEVAKDFQRISVRVERGMGYYAEALAWARLVLDEMSPLTGAGKHRAPSLLFPMEQLFEAFVAKYLAKQIKQNDPPFKLVTQARTHCLVQHNKSDWFQLKPDLLVRSGTTGHLVLDTKWKTLSETQSSGSDKYGLVQADFYQLFAYGRYYLANGSGDAVLIYPKTDQFSKALPVFKFKVVPELRLWVLPFCLDSKHLLLPDSDSLKMDLSGSTSGCGLRSITDQNAREQKS